MAARPSSSPAGVPDYVSTREDRDVGLAGLLLLPGRRRQAESRGQKEGRWAEEEGSVRAERGGPNATAEAVMRPPLAQTPSSRQRRTIQNENPAGRANSLPRGRPDRDVDKPHEEVQHGHHPLRERGCGHVRHDDA
jgi:hypothetical protein